MVVLGAPPYPVIDKHPTFATLHKHFKFTEVAGGLGITGAWVLFGLYHTKTTPLRPRVGRYMGGLGLLWTYCYSIQQSTSRCLGYLPNGLAPVKRTGLDKILQA
ncbi:unnamed protein product [Chrysoparadoxa australica]